MTLGKVHAQATPDIYANIFLNIQDKAQKINP